MATSTVFSSGFSPVLHAQAPDEFRLLSAAASKAEEAASRYENNTAGLLLAKNPALRKDIEETSNLSAIRHFPLEAPPIVPNSLESIQGMGRDDNIQDGFKANDRGYRSLTPQMSSSSTLERSLNPAACIGASQDDDLAPSLHPKMPRNTESLCNKKIPDQGTQKNSTLVSTARMSGSQILAGEAYSSNPFGPTTSITIEGGQSRKSIECPPLKDKAVDQRRQHKPPKPIIEWMNGEKPLAFEAAVARSRPETFESVGAKEALKRRSFQPQTSPAHQISKEAFKTPRQMPNIGATQSPMSDAVKTANQPMKNSSVQNPGQSSTTYVNSMPLHLVDDVALAQAFKDTIYNSIEAWEKDYPGRLPEDILRMMGKSVSDYRTISSAKML